MNPARATGIAALALAVVVAGCTAGQASPSAPVSEPASVAPSVPASPTAEGFALRTSLSQAISPVDAYRSLHPPLAIQDGVAIIPAPQDAIFPPGLVTTLEQHPISDAGVQTIISAAATAGLLSGPTDFAPDRMPGSKTAELQFVISGVARTVSGDPDRQIVCVTAPCDPAPGTPEAFAGFWAKLQDLPAFVGDELGEAAVYRPERLALLLTEPPVDATLPPQYADWPIAGVSMRDFGTEIAGTPPARCGIVEGEALPAVVAALDSANTYTRWRDGSGDEFGIVSRPLFPDEASPCGPG